MRVSAPPSPRPSLRSRWRVALASLCLAWSALACGEAIQRNFFFQTINTEHGLAQSTVTAFLQDRLGFIWIGTSSGLQQYDGYGFNTFQHSGDDPDSPPEGPVSALAEVQTSEEGRKLVRQVERSLETMEDLLRTLLDISKLDAGVVQPEQVWMSRTTPRAARRSPFTPWPYASTAPPSSGSAIATGVVRGSRKNSRS